MNNAVSKLHAWKKSPLLFVTEVLGVTPSSQQVEILLAFADTSEKRLTVRSGHGTGKDAVASWIVLWFLTLHRDSKVVCTAPTSRQLADILWSEISKWLNKSDMLKEEFTVQTDKIYHNSNPKGWWCRAVSASVRSTKDEQAETLAGFHGEDLLFIVDECSGVPDPVFIPLEGALTQENNRILLIGNMTKSKGYFYDSHFHKEISKGWKKFHWDSSKSTNVKPDYPVYMASKYGIDSDIYRIRVEGNPPIADTSAYIPLAWAQQCIGRDIPIPEDAPLYLGVDVARYGDDSSVVLPREGNLIHTWEEYRGMDTVDIAGFTAQTYQELSAVGVAIDEIGVGAGVVDNLRRRNLPGLQGVNVASSSSDPREFTRLRDEIWGKMREKCRAGSYSFPVEKLPGSQESYGDMLANELSAPSYSFDNNGAIKVESKKEMRARGVASPNIADALGISEALYTASYRIWERGGKKKASRTRGRSFPPPTQNNQLWMAQ